MSGKTVAAIRVSGTRAACMARAPSPGPTVASTKAISYVIFARDSVSTSGRMVACIVATGNKAKWTEKERTFLKLVKSSKVSGKMEKDISKKIKVLIKKLL